MAPLLVNAFYATLFIQQMFVEHPVYARLYKFRPEKSIKLSQCSEELEPFYYGLIHRLYLFSDKKTKH